MTAAAVACLAGLVSAAPTVARQITTATDERTFAQPERAVIALNGRMMAYVLGDVLWAQRLKADGSLDGRPIHVAVGMRRDAGYDREFEAFSNDGSRLVFRTGRGGVYNQGELWLALFDAGGRNVNVRPLLDAATASRIQTFVHFAGGGAAWAPDNRRVAFPAVDIKSDKNLQAYVVDTDTGSLSRWTDDATWKFSVAWRPSGRDLAIGTGHFAEQTGTIVLHDGTQRRELLRLRTRWLTDVIWSPNGDRLVAQTDTGSSVQIEVGSSGAATPVPLPALPYRAFTPDGSQLVAVQAKGMSSRIALVDLRSRALSLITEPDIVASVIGIAGSSRSAVLFYTSESGAIPRRIHSAAIAAGRRSTTRTRVLVESVGSLNHALPARFAIFRWKSEDQELDAKLYIPADKRAGNPPPVVIVPYGGYVNDFDDPSGFLQRGLLHLMQRGWTVVRPNTRCPTGERSCGGHYGDLDLQDTERLIEALTKERIVDPRRIAFVGHSHGGTLTYYYATHARPGLACAAIAVNGRADWELQARYGDRYLVSRMGGTPDQIPEAYARFSPTRNATSATMPVLAVAGRLDTQISPANANAIANALQAVGKPVELLEFPDDGHLIVKPENATRLWDRVYSFLSSHCPVRPPEA